MRKEQLLDGTASRPSVLDFVVLDFVVLVLENQKSCGIYPPGNEFAV